MGNRYHSEHPERHIGGGPKHDSGGKVGKAPSIKEGGPTYAKLPGAPSPFKRDQGKFGAKSVRIYRADQHIMDSGGEDPFGDSAVNAPAQPDPFGSTAVNSPTDMAKKQPLKPYGGGAGKSPGGGAPPANVMTPAIGPMG